MSQPSHKSRNDKNQEIVDDTTDDPSQALTLWLLQHELTDYDQDLFPQPKGEGFTLFPKLPIELRLRIWQATLPRGRQVLLSPTPATYESRIPLPAALYVSHESRKAILERLVINRFTRIVAGAITYGHVVINIKWDTVVIAAGSLFDSTGFLEWLLLMWESQGDKLERIRRLEICFADLDGYHFGMVLPAAEEPVFEEDPFANRHPVEALVIVMKAIEHLTTSFMFHTYFLPLLLFKGLEIVTISRLGNTRRLVTPRERNRTASLETIQLHCRTALENYKHRFVSKQAPRVDVRVSPRAKPWVVECSSPAGEATQLMAKAIPYLVRKIIDLSVSYEWRDHFAEVSREVFDLSKKVRSLIRDDSNDSDGDNAF